MYHADRDKGKCDLRRKETFEQEGQNQPEIADRVGAAGADGPRNALTFFCRNSDPLLTLLFKQLLFLF
jgi:hypothetical protein